MNNTWIIQVPCSLALSRCRSLPFALSLSLSLSRALSLAISRSLALSLSLEQIQFLSFHQPGGPSIAYNYKYTR